MHEEHGFTFLTHIPGLEHAPVHVVHAVFVAVVVIALTSLASVKLARAKASPEGAQVPESRWTFRNFFEVVAEKLYSLCESVMGHHDAHTFYPMIGTLFIFIFVSNLLGLFPGFLPPTDNLNTTLALGIFVFFYYNIAGLRANGMAYLKHFLGPIMFIAPLMVVIELVSHVFRPLSLALRLRGNIMGDHVVLSVFTDLTHGIGAPIVFMGLGLFVAFIQAFVFSLMTMVYISLSTAHDH